MTKMLQRFFFGGSALLLALHSFIHFEISWYSVIHSRGEICVITSIEFSIDALLSLYTSTHPKWFTPANCLVHAFPLLNILCELPFLGCSPPSLHSDLLCTTSSFALLLSPTVRKMKGICEWFTTSEVQLCLNIILSLCQMIASRLTTATDSCQTDFAGTGPVSALPCQRPL